MLISFPFLRVPKPRTDDDQNDGTFGLGEKSGKGAFPVSHQFGWHGGVHLVAPGDTNPEPVRAIADGEVVFARPSAPKPTQTPSEEEREAYPLYYYAGWTSNGVVVLKHKTEIGEGVEVVFYSIYQHLSIVANKTGAAVAWNKGDRVYRKDPIGQAGDIYGKPNCIHFEIVADEANVKQLMGRSEGKLKDDEGRRNSVWGDMHIVIPAGTPLYAVNPRTETRKYIVRAFSSTAGAANETLESVAQRFHTTPERILVLNGKTAAQAGTWWPKVTGALQPPNQPLTTSQRTIRVPAVYGAAAATPPEDLTAEVWAQWTILPIGHTQEAFIVTLSESRGTITLNTYEVSGVWRGRKDEVEGAYKLYKTATDTYPGCPSAGYEMLRFGRILGPDAPAATDLHEGRLPHFREIAVDANTAAFADLNRAGIKVYSDADFPHWQGWTFIDDDTDGNSRCDSKQLLDLIEPMLPTPHPAPGLTSPLAEVAHGAATVIDAAIQYRNRLMRAYAKAQTGEMRGRLSYCVVKMPTEWARDDFDRRWSWLQGVEGENPVANIVFPMCLGDPAYERLKRHHQALAFWEEAVENGLTLEKEHYHFHPMKFIDVFKKCGWLCKTELARALPNARSVDVERFLKPINFCMRKYLGESPIRRSHFIGQMAHETGSLSGTMAEKGNSSASRQYETDADYFRGPDSYVKFLSGQGYEKINNDLGNEYSPSGTGDGIKFRGRGSLQITGRANYASYWVYRGWLRVTSFDASWWSVNGWWSTPRLSTIRPAVINNPQRISVRQSGNEYNPVDVGGMFWVDKNINPKCDHENPNTIAAVTSDAVSMKINRYDTPTFPVRRARVEAAKKVICDALQ